MRSYLLQDEFGQILEADSISAGLDYPGIGPEHAHLAEHRAGPATARRPTTRSWTLSSCWLAPRASSRPWSRRTPWPGWPKRSEDRRSAAGSTVLITMSGRGATRTPST